MKNFLVYSKQPIQTSINLDDAVNIRLVRKGLRFLYLFDITGIASAVFNRFYLLGFLILINLMLFSILLSLEFLDPISKYLISIKYSMHVLLVIFGFEIEEFFLKRKKYKIEAFVTAKNSRIAFEWLISELNIHFIKKPSFRFRMLNFFKGFFCKVKCNANKQN